MIIYKPTPKIKAMTFDLDDTLYDNWPYIIEAEKGLLNFIAKEYPDSSHLTKDDWQQYKRSALRDDPELFSDMGDLRRVVLSKGLEEAGYRGQALERAVQTCFDWFYFERSNFKVGDAECQLLAKLSEQIPLIAITNGNVNTQQIGIDGYFQKVLKASRQSPMKPSPHMFDEAAKLLSIERASILHVGDHLIKDVWGACNAGFSSAWHACDRPMKLRNETVQVLPNVEIKHLNELLAFIKS
ncbi:HAD-IA family hydrolase [Glaciecola sp.]|uniref:HAD-IA family hydrolase n=1 Tax=Glaciecola sp. MF2-115 TaxID=3384827 RepID=UPI0039899FBC